MAALTSFDVDGICTPVCILKGSKANRFNVCLLAPYCARWSDQSAYTLQWLSFIFKPHRDINLSHLDFRFDF